MATKARYWGAVCYPENMRDDWQDVIGDVIGYPVAYCIHDKDHLAKYKPKKGAEDEERQRKVHVHLLIAYGNTTTYSAVLELVNRLSAEGKRCCNTVKQIYSVRNAYEYLIHNTQAARKQKKFLYPEAERVCLNNFDIGAYEQVSISDKKRMKREIIDIIRETGMFNFADVDDYILDNMPEEYHDVFEAYSGYFDRRLRGMFNRYSHEYDDASRKRMDWYDAKSHGVQFDPDTGEALDEASDKKEEG